LGGHPLDARLYFSGNLRFQEKVAQPGRALPRLADRGERVERPSVRVRW
jgi:hypothetical protein